MVKLFLLSIIENLNMENIWDNILGKKVSQTFGQECASAAIWMFFVLFLRSILLVFGVMSYIPNGLLFSFPFFIQLLSRYIPFMRESIPLISVRVVECILGRVSSSHFLVVFPAHFLGCIVGTVCFQLFCPTALYEAFEPVQYVAGRGVIWFMHFFFEIVLNSFFCFCFVVVKEILILNKFREEWLSILIFPLYYIVTIDECPTFNPAALYALWYVNIVSTGTAPDNFQQTSQIQIEHILGPVLGAIFTGLFCLRFFPDDPASWKTK